MRHCEGKLRDFRSPVLMGIAASLGTLGWEEGENEVPLKKEKEPKKSGLKQCLCLTCTYAKSSCRKK